VFSLESFSQTRTYHVVLRVHGVLRTHSPGLSTNIKTFLSYVSHPPHLNVSSSSFPTGLYRPTRPNNLTEPIDHRPITGISREVECQLAISDIVVAGCEAQWNATTHLTAMLWDEMGDALDGGARGAAVRVLQVCAHVR